MPQYGKYHTRPQDAKFVKEFVSHGSGTEAALEAYGASRKLKRTSAAAVATRKLRSPEIREMIRAETQRQGITAEYIVGARKKIIDKGLSDIQNVIVTPSDVNKSLERLEKILGVDGDSGVKSKSVHQHIHLNDTLTRSEVVEKRNELKDFFDEI